MAPSRERTNTDLKKQLATIESSSRNIGSRLKVLQREAESLKIEYLKYFLEKRRMAAARERGLALLIKDERKMGTALAVAAGGLILGGLIAQG